MSGRRTSLALLFVCLWIWAASWPAEVSAQQTRIQQVLQGIRADRIKKDVEDLAGLGSRYTLSPGFFKASQMVRDKLTSAGLTVILQPLEFKDKQVHNVSALLPGSVSGRPAIIICAHYDSLNFFDLNGPAPGAEDNASGTSAVLEIARVLAKQKLATDVWLIAFAAEEQGLVGSRHLVQELKNKGATGSVQAVINMDMVGYNPRGDQHMIVDTVRIGRTLAARVGAAAQAHVPGLKVSAGIFSQGRSDHRPFLDVDIDAVTLASFYWRNYSSYHSAEDLPQHVDPQMVASVARTAAATTLLLAGFANGPPVAHAGRFVEAAVGQRVELSAAASFDPAGKALTCSWTQTGGAAVTTSSAGARLTFTPRVAGTYRFELVVSTSDGRVSQPDVAAALVFADEGCNLVEPAQTGWWALPVLLLLALFWGRRRLVDRAGHKKVGRSKG